MIAVWECDGRDIRLILVDWACVMVSWEIALWLYVFVCMYTYGHVHYVCGYISVPDLLFLAGIVCD